MLTCILLAHQLTLASIWLTTVQNTFKLMLAKRAKLARLLWLRAVMFTPAAAGNDTNLLVNVSFMIY